MSEETNEPTGSRAEEDGQNKQGRSRRRRRRRAKGSAEGSGPQTAQAQPQGQEPAQPAAQPGAGKRRTRSRRKNRRSSGHGPTQAAPAPRRKLKTPESKFGGREPRAPVEYDEPSGPREMTPFELFCAYHLGISEDNRYRQPSARDVARRFGCSPQELEQALKRFGLDKETLKKAGYDISLAQLDMQVAPEGVDKRELAKVLFSDFLDMTPQVAMIIEAATSEAAAEEN
jgi:hypothetical protein